MNTSTCEGLVASLSDQSNNAPWGCYGTSIGGTSNGLGTGQANTTAIVTGCAAAGIAARICDDYDDGAGHTDWFLPSKDELNSMYTNLKQNGFGVFASDWYWSSSGHGDYVAWRQDFSDGVQGLDVKHYNNRVRAVRAF
ncbi:MAG: DUF1566 domain-containing protein [Oceanicoccus sp.]|nr:DUF1566 domain-containing protein [Oceanicoccus sp.]